MQAVIQSNLDSLLTQRGLTWEGLAQRVAKENIEPEVLEGLRDLSDANGFLNLRALSAVLTVLDCELNDLFTVIKQQNLKKLRRYAMRRFPQPQQRRLDALLKKASETELTPAESVELHKFTREYEDGMVAKAQALNALKALGEDITPFLRAPNDV
jgi:uncharacterized protein YnzC (UPF0291/DUF896 family)